ncbi:MAG: phosphopantetheine-binding protein [bacterium]|nr:phosphopantetheine-binding protein [bacterium]
MSSDIVEKLKTIIEPYLDEDEVDIDALTPDSHLIQDLGLDSFYVIDVVIDIENEFDIAIENDQISQFETVGQVVSVIQEKLDKK